MSQQTSGRPPEIVVVGAGFAGFFAARRLLRRLKPSEARITLVSDSDNLLYQPLLPDVAVGALNPRTIAVPLATTLKGLHFVRGQATDVDLEARTVHVQGLGSRTWDIAYDRLVLVPGGVTRVLDIPGLAEHAVGFKTIPEAMFLRDLLLRRLELANDESDPERRARLLRFVVVGAGYAGTELVAQMCRTAALLVGSFHHLSEDDLDWKLLDTAPAVMPELGEELGKAALDLLRRRNVDVRLETSVQEVTDDAVTLTDGTVVPGAVVVWCAGVTANPLIGATGLDVVKGRLVVGADLRVPGHPEVYGAGDAASVPDLTKPTGDDGQHPSCPPTAQHAMRQGHALARNLLADVRDEPLRDYRHHDLGLVVDLGGPDAVARPLNVSVKGRLAKVVTRAYHVYALPTNRRRLRTVVDWALAGRTPDDVSFGLSTGSVPLAADEHV